MTLVWPIFKQINCKMLYEKPPVVKLNLHCKLLTDSRVNSSQYVKTTGEYSWLLCQFCVSQAWLSTQIKRRHSRYQEVPGNIRSHHANSEPLKLFRAPQPGGALTLKRTVKQKGILCGVFEIAFWKWKLKLSHCSGPNFSSPRLKSGVAWLYVKRGKVLNLDGTRPGMLSVVSLHYVSLTFPPDNEPLEVILTGLRPLHFYFPI